ncbi:MAG: hypothetical protein ABIJ44_02050 [Pseudomonadota bacterium]
MDKEIFVGSAMHEKVQEKHMDFPFELISFNLGPNKIHIQATIAKELLKMDEQVITRTFEGICHAFNGVCLENHIKCDPIDIFILVGNRLKSGTSTKFWDVVSGGLFAEILIPANDCRVHEYWKYTFLHELGHSWFSLEFSPDERECGYEDLFIDLAAMCTFRKILPAHKRIYREVRKHRTYFLTQQSKRFLGKELYKQILQDPEAYLGDLWQKINSTRMK